ncbi:hypothetical protein J2128_001928 [Methanomicrobium sp. W14]|uniref:hypothetical protein n=1 Tax=Methanomicrobium sp. W14 TaxID=2817839 RepID=UPI001AE8EFCF|nr:hypothetical protein [Methanomicrobium sp. W14]MBP2133962.1 hypothetical protein [Methanomicrobium sp. W14]
MSRENKSYVHGYSDNEAKRLSVQAKTLNKILYGDITYPPGSLVLEAGCGTMTVIEGDHGSAFFFPDSGFAKKDIECLVALQKKAGGDALIGRKLYPVLREAGLSDVHVSPRIIYADSSYPELVEGFTKKTFTAMVEGVEEKAISSGIITKYEWDRGISDLYKTAGENGTFCYTFFEATGKRPDS